MATGATKESIRASEEQHKIANDDGGRVCEAPATAEDPDFRLVSEQDDSAVGEQDPSTKDPSTKDPSMASAAANDVDEAMEADEDSATASKAEVNEATLSSESSTMPDSVGDLFDDCAAVNSATQVFNEGESQEAQTAGPAISDGQHQPAEPVATETIEASESGENRLEPEDPDASVKEADATPSSSIVIANESANASDVSSTVEGPTETQPAAESSTVGVKRAAPSPTSALPAFSWNDILRVQNLIERCLQQYLTKREILEALQTQASVDPSFADVVWQKLEEQNPSFFRAYHIQLRLKEQTVAFNYLVTQQKEMSAKRVKRRHVRTSSAAPKSTKRRGSTSSSIFSPAASFSASDSLFTSAVDDAESCHGDGLSTSTANSLIAQLPPPSPLPLPSPIKTELDTHAFFT